MSVYVQYGKVGKPIKYTTLPTASATLNGVIGQVGEDIYLCNGTTWEKLNSGVVQDIKGISFGTPVNGFYTTAKMYPLSQGVYNNCVPSYFCENLFVNKTSTILSYWFFAKDVKTITFDETITHISTNAFNGCTNITKMTIPSSVTSIDDMALYTGKAGTNTSFTFLGTTPPTIVAPDAVNSGTFNISGLAAIFVPASAVNTYKTATNWAGLADYIQAIAN